MFLNKFKYTGLFWTWLSLLVIVLDRVTKIWASASLTRGEPQAVWPFFNLTLMHNPGAAFSFLADAGGWQRWLFTALALIVSVVLMAWMIRLSRNNILLGMGLASILGGALGNVWDRLQHGYVVDFIDLYYQGWHWPAFNIADSAITIGAFLLILDALLHHDKPEAAREG